MQLHGDLFWNICDFWELESPQMEARGGHNPSGRTRGARRGMVGCAHLVHRLELYFGRKEAYIHKILCKKISIVGVMDLQEF